jgi:methyl-accepting chemotaxis protein
MSIASLLRVLASAGAVLSCSGCLFVQAAGDRPPEPERQRGTMDAAAKGTVTIEEIEEMVQGFADRYYALITTASDALVRVGLDPDARLALDRFQTRTITAVYDIASNPDPFTQLLDLTVVVTLTSTIATDEGVAERTFGEHAPLLTRPLHKARTEIWDIAARTMTNEQLETLDRLIVQWRRDNPEVESVSFVRFDDFASSRGKSVIADVRSGTGLLAPVDEAKQAVNEARLFGERMFYIAKRAPLLISMEAGAVMSQIAAMPEVRQAAELGRDLTASADRISRVAEELPRTIREEREQFVEGIERSSTALRDTLGEYRNAVDRTDQLVHSVQELSTSANSVIGSIDGAAGTLTETIAAAERLAERLQAGRDAEAAAKPVDPELYARMMADLRGSLVEVNRALEQTKVLAEGSLWQRPMSELDRISRERVEHAGTLTHDLVDAVFWRAMILVVVTFVLLVLYRVWLRSTVRPIGQDSVRSASS